MVLNDIKQPLDTRIIMRDGVRGFGELYYRSFEEDGFFISNTSFDNENVLVFDVRGMYSIFIQLQNTSLTETVDYKIEFITAESETPETLPASFLSELVPLKQIPADSWSNATLDAGENISEFIRATSKITFLKISLLTSAGPTNVKGTLVLT